MPVCYHCNAPISYRLSTLSWIHLNGSYYCYGTQEAPSTASPTACPKPDYIEPVKKEKQTFSRLIYLASPYSSKVSAIRSDRATAAEKANAELSNLGILCYSPIAHTHSMSEKFSLPGDWTFWQNFCRVMINACDELWILTLDGWQESVGVTSEIAIAKELGKPIRYISPSEAKGQ